MILWKLLWPLAIKPPTLSGQTSLRSLNLQHTFSETTSYYFNFKNMPKNKSGSILKNKNSSKSKSARFPPSELYLCVLGNGSISSPKALYMVTDHERYIFNCGEGTQRLASEYKMKLPKVDHVFITHKSWENLGGLLGLSLTLQDAGKEKITLHGPPDIDSLFGLSSSFIFLNTLQIHTKHYENKFFNDDCMKVDYIPIFKTNNPSELVEISSDSHSSDDEYEEHEPKKLRFSPHDSNDVIIAYACKGHSKLGHLLFDKCVELGVPSGPLLGDLKNGKDVTLPSGKIVYSKDVVSPEEVCPLFLVVECPSEEFLDPFVNEEQFKTYQNGTENTASLIVHFTPPEIINTSRYQEWIQKFPDTTCHLILNNDCATLNSYAIHRLQYKLNLLHPGIFTVLHEKEAEEKAKENMNKNIFYARTLDRYYLRPANGFDRSSVVSIDCQGFIEEAINTKDFSDSLEQFQNNIKKSEEIKGDLYPEITFLGTGSSIPNKVRNVSAILLKTSENEYMMLDCGEGTYGQLLRCYGKECEKILLNIFCIFVSHMHADHHLGLIKLLKEREYLQKKFHLKSKPVLIVGPRKLNNWIKNYYRNFESSMPHYRFNSCSSMEHEEVFQSNCAQELENNEDILLSTVPVNHCLDAHGAIISSKSFKWKVVYSGDTTPCKRLVSAGQGCSLLIHEATMEDELADEAFTKRHSTTSEAIKIGEEMNSKYTILTHFSQRYAKVPLFNESFHNHIGCAFDNMKVRPNEFYVLPLMIPVLKSLFAADVEDMQIRGHKRRQKLELIKAALAKSELKEIVKEKG